MVPVEDCTVSFGVLGAFASVAIASTSFLFFLRVRAIYLQSRCITAVFGILWLVIVVLNVMEFASLRAGQFRYDLADA